MDAVPITKKLIAFGSNKIYLPKFTVALVRSPKLSPYHARFLVPLDFSKYDLRDYLYHAYNVRCFNIRSYVKQMPVRDYVNKQRHWFRPESEKYMTIEMEQPFVWPQVPDLEPWSQKDYTEQIAEMTNTRAVNFDEARANAAKLRNQADKLLNKRMVSQDPKTRKKMEQGAFVSEDEQATWLVNSKEKKKLHGMSRTQVWERERPDKRIEGDGDGYAIKA